jgi:predicted lipoprotein with Yx(FWY)xxD motif
MQTSMRKLVNASSMVRRRRRTLPTVGAVAAGIALLAAGCGSGGASSGATSVRSESPTTPATGAVAKLAARKTGKLGKVLVDGRGRTLYLFAQDTGRTSTCSGACAKLWPPFTGHVKAGPGISAAKLGHTTRADGARQVTYNGHPLYSYTPDGDQPGSTTGEAIDSYGAPWYVVSPRGNAIKKAPGSGAGGSSSSGGYGGY